MQLAVTGFRISANTYTASMLLTVLHAMLILNHRHCFYSLTLRYTYENHVQATVGIKLNQWQQGE